MHGTGLLLVVAVCVGSLPAQKCGTGDDISCICEWKWEDRAHSQARGYFLTEEFWNRVPKVCWKELIQVRFTKRPDKKNLVPGADRTRVTSPALPEALKRARKENKLVFFIGMTGG